MKYITLIVVICLMVACNSTKNITPIETKTENITPTVELAQGKLHFENHCANCHDLFDPTFKTAKEWQVIVPQMAEYINGAKNVMDKKTEASILNYLVSKSKDK